MAPGTGSFSPTILKGAGRNRAGNPLYLDYAEQGRLKPYYEGIVREMKKLLKTQGVNSADLRTGRRSALYDHRKRRLFLDMPIDGGRWIARLSYSW